MVQALAGAFGASTTVIEGSASFLDGAPLERGPTWSAASLPTGRLRPRLQLAGDYLADVERLLSQVC
jgi:hypothetical protein